MSLPKICSLSCITVFMVGLYQPEALSATFEFEFIGESGQNQGLLGMGELSFDEGSINGVGEELVFLNELINPSFSFTFNTIFAGVTTEENIEEPVLLSFNDGDLVQLDFDAPVRINIEQDLLAIGNLQVQPLLAPTPFDFVNVNLITSNGEAITSVDVTFGTIRITNSSETQSIPEPFSVLSLMAFSSFGWMSKKHLK